MMTSEGLLLLVIFCATGVMRSESVVSPITTVVHVVDNLECAAMQLRPFDVTTGNVPNSDVLIFTLRTCLPDYPYNEKRLNCEQNETSPDLDVAVPVLHIPTGNVYKNTYCAECNRLVSSELTQWSVHVSCIDDQYWPPNFDDMVTDVLASAGCNILFQYPTDVNTNCLPTCSPGELLYCNLKMKSVCTLWINDHTNVHGVSCSWVEDPESNACNAPVDVVDTTEATFALAMRYEMAAISDETVADSTPDPTCGDGTYHDELLNVCRGLTCGPMRKLANTTCLSIVQDIRGATVDFAIMMTPLVELINVLPGHFSSISHEVLVYGVNIMKQFSLDVHSNISLLYNATFSDTTKIGRRLCCASVIFTHVPCANVCRGLTCGPMRKLVNTTCLSIVQDIRGATVDFAIMMTPLVELINVLPGDFTSISDEVLVYGVHIIEQFSLDGHSNISLLYSAALSDTAKVRLDFAAPVVDLLMYYVLYVTISIPSSMSVDTDVLDDIFSLHDSVASPGSGNNAFRMEFITVRIETDAHLDPQYYNEPFDEILRFYATQQGSSFISLQDTKRYTLLSTSGPCPLVTLSANEFFFQNLTRTIVVMHAAIINFSFEKRNVVEVYESGRVNSMLACVDSYHAKIRQHVIGQNRNTFPISFPTTSEPWPSDPPWTFHSSMSSSWPPGPPSSSSVRTSTSTSVTPATPTLGSAKDPLELITATSNPTASLSISSTTVESHNGLTRVNQDDKASLIILICSCLSIICLLLTILTYGMFRELRTRSGTNNILLCAVLFFAQAFLPFTAVKHEVIADDSSRDEVCRTIGVFTQLFWLTASAWLNVCCFHASKLSISTNLNKRKYALMCLMYVVIVALVPSFVGVVFSTLHDITFSHFEQLHCYIFEKDILWWTFALPMSFTLGITAAFYLVNQFRFITKAGNYETSWGAYVGLSALVGCVWAFALAYMSSGHTFFEIMVGVFNVALGACALWLFVGNRRCVRIYHTIIRKCSSRGTPRCKTSTVNVLSATETM